MLGRRCFIVAPIRVSIALIAELSSYTQSATADLMRLRSIDLANASADIKMGATNTTNLRQALANLLQHQ
jgi:hypothetical protein